jgi:pyruvate kinase
MIDHQKTKIVATIGPASENPEVLEQLIRAGLDVARLNFSHGTHEWHAATIEKIRSVAQKVGSNVAIVADLQGPRVRTLVTDPVEIAQDDVVVITDSADSVDGVKTIGIDQAVILPVLAAGHRIFIEDGLIQLEITEVGDQVKAKVLTGGVVKNHKGVNLPDTDVPLPSLTEKDEKDLAFAVSHDVEFVALSFVRRASDVLDLRKKIMTLTPAGETPVRIIVKIERPEAVENLEEIIMATDAVMVARGDLATEVGPARVGVLQKTIIQKALNALKPVIVATQMLASMENNPRPTRAEVSDVTNAVIDHADAVMLSGESASGQHPIKSVQMMHDIITETEDSPFDDVTVMLPSDAYEGIVQLAEHIVSDVRKNDVENIVCTVRNVRLAQALAHYRPARRIIAITDNLKVSRQLALVWGVEAFHNEQVFTDDAGELSIEDIRKKYSVEGKMMVVTMDRYYID